MDEVLALDAVGQAELVRSKQVSAAELVAASMARIEAVNPSINAVIRDRSQRATEEAAAVVLDGRPFAGVPTLLKDAGGELAGEPISYGMAVLRDAGWRAPVDSNITVKLREAGFMFVGFTNSPELANQATTEPIAYGATANPWDLTRTAGGSSGGAAAAVAAGMVAVAHGNDGGGSIRIPASACGLVGLKASRGRVSMGPMLGELPGGIGVQGMLCRSVRDAAALLDVVAGPMAGDPYALPKPDSPFLTDAGRDPGRLQIGVATAPPDGLSPIDADCIEAVRRAAGALADAGHVVDDATPSLPSWSRLIDDLTDLWAVETGFQIEGFGRAIRRPLTPDDLEPYNWRLLEHARALGALDHVAGNNWRARVTRSLATWWDAGHDLLVTPTVRTVPPRLGEVVPSTGDPLDGWRDHFAWIPFTPMWNATGQPAISLPTHTTSDGIPVGVQLVAAYGREDLLLRVAAQLETQLPWSDRRPALA